MKPRCRYCDKPLVENTRKEYARVAYRPRKSKCCGAAVVFPEQTARVDGYPYCKSCECYVETSRRKIVSCVQLGTFGPYRDGFFCSLKHGYAFAIRECTRERTRIRRASA